MRSASFQLRIGARSRYPREKLANINDRPVEWMFASECKDMFSFCQALFWMGDVLLEMGRKRCQEIISHARFLIRFFALFACCNCRMNSFSRLRYCAPNITKETQIHKHKDWVEPRSPPFFPSVLSSLLHFLSQRSFFKRVSKGSERVRSPHFEFLFLFLFFEFFFELREGQGRGRRKGERKGL